jgi:RND family efflux transporter MFP subunit
VVSLNESEISSEILARIIDIPVLVGQQLHQGDVLVRLDCDAYLLSQKQARAALTAVEAREELADYQYKRARSLQAKGSVSEELLKQREAEWRTAQADTNVQTSVVEMAKRDVDHCDIRAPFDAIVLSRIAQVGELGQPGTPLVKVLDVNNIEVSSKIRGEDVSSLEELRKAEFISLGKRYPVRLRMIIPAFDVRERNREARLVFVDNHALPGSSGDIEWSHVRKHVPSHILVRRNGKMGVFVLNERRAHFVSLPEASEGRPALVNLPSDTPVIIEGRHALQHGDEVQVQ